MHETFIRKCGIPVIGKFSESENLMTVVIVRRLVLCAAVEAAVETSTFRNWFGPVQLDKNGSFGAHGRQQ
jgi:hypothetical protein